MYCAICKIGFNVNKELFTFGVLVDKFRPSPIHRSAMSPRTITIGSQNCCFIYKNSLAVPLPILIKNGLFVLDLLLFVERERLGNHFYAQACVLLPKMF